MIPVRPTLLFLFITPMVSLGQLHPQVIPERGGSTIQGCDPSLTVDFTANILGSFAYQFDPVVDQGNTYVVGSVWSYLAGDIEQSTDPELQTVFPGPGEYPVCLTVNALDAGTFQPCSTSTCRLIDALPDSSCLDLNPDFTIGLINDATITFQDLTSFSGQSFTTSWSFDDGSTVAGLQATHTFEGSGPHKVCMNVLGGPPGYCSTTLCKWLYLGPGNAPCELFLDPGFIHASSGQLVGVLDTSVTSGLDHDITWDFGDGTSAEGAIAVHAYTIPGSYSLCRTLRMWGAVLSDTCLTTECVEINTMTQVGIRDGAGENEWTASPNPFQDQLVLIGPAAGTEVVSLMDVGGRFVQRWKPAPGQERTVLDLIDLRPGVYLLEVSSVRSVRTLRVIKE